MCYVLFVFKEEVAAAHAAVKRQKEMLNTQNKEINAKAALKEKLIKEASDAQLEIKQLDHKLSKLKSEAKDAENKVIYIYLFIY